jgi:hypothetical protein
MEEGSHQQLLKKRGIYHKLYQLQYKDQLTEIPERPFADPKTPFPEGSGGRETF